MDLQNHINTSLHSNPELSHEYLLSTETPPELRTICLAICLEKGFLETLKKFTERAQLLELNNKDLEILIENIKKDIDYFFILLTYFSKLTLEQRGEFKGIFESKKALDLYENLLEKAATLDQVNSIFKRSIDPGIRKYGRRSVIERTIAIPHNTYLNSNEKEFTQEIF